MAPDALGQYEIAVLVAVSRLGNGAYGGSVRREVTQRLRREQSVGAVYTTLQRLEDKGLVTSWMSDPQPVRGGRSKRFFRLTTAGAQALRTARAASERLWAGRPPRWRPA